MADLGPDGDPLTVSLGVSVGKTPILKTNELTTTLITANQVVLTYTVTANKVFYLQYLSTHGSLSVVPGNSNPIDLGNISLETPSGTKIIHYHLLYPRDLYRVISFAEPIPVASGVVISVVCTPSSTSGMSWIANLGGYEK